MVYFLFRDAFDEFTILADSWRYSQQYSSSLFFVLIDIDEDGMDAFQQVRTVKHTRMSVLLHALFFSNPQMHLTTAPTYFHFPPSGKRKPEDKFDIARSIPIVCVCVSVCVCVLFFHYSIGFTFRHGYQAEPLGKWVEERTGVRVSLSLLIISNLLHIFVCFLKISVMRPPNYTLLMIWIPVLLFAVIVGYVKRENLHIIYEPRHWAILAMVSEGGMDLEQVAVFVWT